MRPTHPGRLVAWELAEMGLTIETAADLMHASTDDLANIINESQDMTAEMALRLGRMFGNGPDLWLALQLDYDARWLAADLKRIPEPA